AGRRARKLPIGRAHDHVSFPCAIPTNPISKTTSQFHQPYSYSLPPLQRSARCPDVRPRGARGSRVGNAQLSEYPSLDYQGLYVTLRDPARPGAPAAARSACHISPFLHKDIIEYLSTSFLPMAILGSTRREGGVPAYVNLSASSMLMIAMQYTSNPVYHCQLLECLMKHKQEVWKDLLYVISYGPSQVKPPAVQMLFHYWPNLKPPGAISEYRGLQYTAWNPIHCQHIECHNAINKPAVKMCIDPTLSVALGDKPPPLYICEECSQRIAGDHPEWLVDVLLPQAEISAICQKKNCSSHVRRAVVTCFSAGCCGRHGNRPVRYCKRCHVNHHSSEVGAAAETHLYQTSPPPINTRECGAEELVCTMGLSASHHSLDNIDFDNKEDDQHDQRLLSQFGIWFLVSLCTPNENTPTESLARLVGMVFQWFHSTAYMLDDEVGSLVEKLKPQFVTKWLKTVCDVRFDVMVMCLLPKPVEFARVGGYWDKSCSTVTQLKEGLNRILCLIPYNVISQPLWECFMPEWLEAIRTEVPDHQLKEFREVLSKMFDIELCPLPFSMEEMFGFISCRFSGYPASVQEQALLWLHVLSQLDIVVPLQLLIGMFSDGVNSVKELANQRKARVSNLTGNTGARRVSVVSDPGRRGQHNTLSPFPSPFRSPFHSPLHCSPFKNLGHATGHCALDLDCDDDDMNLGCFILMFDLILKQMELQDDGVMLGLDSSLGKDIVGIINNVFQAPWGGSHTCQKDEKALECSLCQSSILCYQLGCELLERLTPREEIRLVLLHAPSPLSNGADIFWNLIDAHFNSKDWKIRFEAVEKVAVLCRFLDIGSVTKNHLLKYSLAHAFCCFLASVEDVNPAVATRARLLLDTIKRPALQDMSKFEEPDILFNMLSCLRILCLHGECLYLARKDHPHFLTYIQEKMLIPSKDWKMRFEAVEKVAVLCRFLDIGSVTKNHLLKYSLAHAFCCFLASVEDVNPAVATRARLLLDTIKRPALQGLCLCLDFQFDTVVRDRPIILSKLLLLHSLQKEIPALSWEFFVNRFETLSLEAQLHLDCNKEFPFPTTITAVRTNVANLSDAAMWKIRRARFARNRQKSVRSLRDSVKGPPSAADCDDSTIRDVLPEDAGIDHQTVHQLIMVLMKFMSKDQSSAEADIGSAKAFNTVKRHLYVLLGYDQQEGCFMIAPQKMRTSTCFNAFIAGIAQVMDYNIGLGKQLLPLVVQVLKYCTCPQLRHYFQQPPRCSLWALRPHIRQMWLKALLVILYKYPYRDMDGSKVILHLIHITVNTLNAQYHSCRPHATAGPLYSDNSNMSRYSEKEKGPVSFDTVVRDRPIILSKLLLLHSLQKEIPALSWEFFVNRFETLSLEAQLHLDCNKEFPFPTTITAVRTNVANLSDAAMWKIRRARFARNRQKSVRSLRDSVKGPSESKRAFSLPESLSSRLLEKVAVLCRFLDIGSVTKNHLLKYSLAHAFCCFLASVEDVNPAVATRARLLLDTIKRPALQLLLLHSLQKEIPALSWEFFVNRFETLSLEAQLHLDCNKEFPFPTTITAVRTNVANLSDAAMWKIRRARFARNRQKSTPSPEDDSTIRDVLPEDAGIDHQTVHQLIMVLMKFMSKDQSSAEADIGSAKAFNTVKRHLYVLLGYDQQEGCFMIAPQKMRTSTCFNAFIAGIAQVMDYNIGLGKQLLPLVVQVLKYCTCPQLRHYFQQPPRCSLWALRPHIRQMWLKALLVILYKYPYRDMDGSKVILHLIHITVNTLNAQYHSCRPHATAGPLYSDNSNMSRYSEKEKGDIELSEYREAGGLQDTILHCVREESTRKKRLQAMHKQQSLDISNTDSILYNLDEHRRKSCIDRCDLQAPRPPPPASSSSAAASSSHSRHHHHHGKGSSDGSSVRAGGSDPPNRRSSRGGQSDCSKPVIPEVRLSCMETFEDRPDQGNSSAGSAQGKGDDQDLIDLSSDCTSIPEKHSLLSMSDSDSLVFEPLPPLRIVESDEEFDLNTLMGSRVNGGSKIPASPASGSGVGGVRPLSPLVSVENCSQCKGSPRPTTGAPLQVEAGPDQLHVDRKPCAITPSASLELPDPAEYVCHESPMTLKQKRDLLRKTPHLPNTSLDDVSVSLEEVKVGLCAGGASPSGRTTVFLDIPEDAAEPASSPEKDSNNNNGDGVEGDDEDDDDMADEGDSDPKADHDSTETEFKIQIVPRQRKQRKIAVSAIQREYLDITFNTLDKLGEQPTDSAQYRQAKRGSLGALTMSQMMKRQLEHQSSAPHNISTWDTGPTKTSLLSAPSTVSMFVPAPEEFIDEQPTTMADSMLIPGNAAGVAKQFLRCMFHQLAPNGILPQLFQSNIKDGSFLRTLASSLIDFNDLSSVAALNMLLEGLNNKKNLPAGGTMLHCLDNIATFMEALPMDSPSNLWTTICNQFQTFLAKLPSVLPLKCPVDSSLRIIICLLKIPTTNATRSLLEPFSKLVSFVIQYGIFSLSYLVELCGLCYKTFNKALKFKSPLPDTNLLLLVQFVCSDIGTRLAESTIIQKHMISSLPGCSTAAMECMRQYTSELLDFIADMHTLTKLKSHMKACCHPLHEDTFGGNLKVGLSQVAAMEISKGNHRDNKAVVRYLPPKEFIECVSHIRQLSWLLLGSLTHCALYQGSTACMPIPLDAGSHIADHLIIILIGFPEQSKTSVLHMCSLFHRTPSCSPQPVGPSTVSRLGAAPALQNQNHNEFSSCAILTGLEFWSRVTPSILQLMAHNKVMVEMVCLHVISLMEALQECNSTIFVKLIPMWLPMIQSNLKHLSAGLQLRLQAIQNRVNHQSLQGQAPGALPLALRKWLQCTQFKMAQVEIQSSEAASQFYPM
ncbi:LOW QUALITY PROTEIN: hypothetical protein CRUP_036279, partial [Coryphaenoides rupestris]